MAPEVARSRPPLLRRDFLYAGVLALVSTVVLVLLLPEAGAPAPGPALFFVAFGLLTIATGYDHPRLGYISFDRVAQVASVLVLGPVHAAWVNGLASLVFPWHRLARGVPLPLVMTASLHNAGLMSLMVLGGGLMYTIVGGPVPLTELRPENLAALVVLLVGMQLINDTGMRVFLSLREGRVLTDVSPFAFVLESAAGVGGILVAIVMNRMETPVVVLLLAVTSLGMVALAQFARMRTRLEAMVEERTIRLREKTLELERLATHDPLTGLYNRRYADEFLEERIEEYQRYRNPLAIALLDLDHFKRINDHYSHDTGDEALRRIAAMLSDRCRETDMVARYGGEEFLLCFPGTAVEDAWQVCETLRRSVADADWERMVPGIPVSLSAGVAGMRAGMTRRTLLEAADRRLYQAKAAGRNRVVT